MNDVAPFRLAIVVSHPIQHFCPQYASFARLPGVQLKVFFASALGLKKYVDKNFGREVSWGNLRLDAFDHVFMNGDAVLQSDGGIDAVSLPAELDAFRPDSIVSYGYYQKLQRMAHKWAGRNKVPVAFISDGENRQKRPLHKRIGKAIYLRWYLRRIDYFFTVGNANEAYYREYGVPSRKFVRMHYPVDLATYEPAFAGRVALREKIRKQYDIGEGDFVISVVGKLVEWKNQGHLVDLLAVLEQKGLKAHVLIIGSGVEMDSIAKRASTLKSNKAHMVGFVDPLALPDFYAASDLYIHPARVEPHSLAISEAIYMGCPVIVSDRCGSYGKTDDVQDGRNGFVYPFGDILDLAQKVERIMLKRSLAEEFSSVSIDNSRAFQARSHGGCVEELIQRVRAAAKR